MASTDEKGADNATQNTVTYEIICKEYALQIIIILLVFISFGISRMVCDIDNSKKYEYIINSTILID